MGGGVFDRDMVALDCEGMCDRGVIEAGVVSKGRRRKKGGQDFEADESTTKNPIARVHR